MTTTVSAADFKARCLQLMNEVQARGDEIIVTKRGKAVAKLVPIEHVQNKAFGRMRGSVIITGDIISGGDEAWEADSDI